MTHRYFMWLGHDHHEAKRCEEERQQLLAELPEIDGTGEDG